MKHRFPPPAAELAIPSKAEDTAYIESVDKGSSPPIENMQVCASSNGSNSY